MSWLENYGLDKLSLELLDALYDKKVCTHKSILEFLSNKGEPDNDAGGYLTFLYDCGYVKREDMRNTRYFYITPKGRKEVEAYRKELESNRLEIEQRRITRRNAIIAMCISGVAVAISIAAIIVGAVA